MRKPRSLPVADASSTVIVMGKCGCHLYDRICIIVTQVEIGIKCPEFLVRLTIALIDMLNVDLKL